MANSISKLHYITQDIEGVSHSELAQQACKGGVDWVQLRMKNVSDEEWLDEAIKTLIVCRKHHAKLIINDNPELAAEIGADGVHLGKGDMNLSEARKIIGTDMILGATANTFEDIVAASNHEIDYIGLGPFRVNISKTHLSPALGLNGYSAIAEALKTDTPIIGFGGIIIKDVKAILETGIPGIGVSDEITKDFNTIRTFNQLLNASSTDEQRHTFK